MSDIHHQRATEWEASTSEIPPIGVDDIADAEGWSPFPSGILPPTLANFIREAAAAGDVNEAAVALPVLAACSGAIGNTRAAAVGDRLESAVLWLVLVAASGAGKTHPAERAIAPLRSLEAAAYAKHRRETAHAEERSKVVPSIRFLVDDATVEGLRYPLETNPRGVLLYRDELAGWVQSMGEYKKGKGGDLQRWLSIHGAASLSWDRAGGREHGRVPRAFVSVVGGVQPETLLDALNAKAVAAGLAGRLLFAMPPKRLRRYTRARVSAEAKARYEGIIEALADTPLDLDANGDPVPRPCELTPEAEALFADFYNRINLRKFEARDDDAAALAKIEGAALRLALLGHLVRWASADTTLLHHERIDAESMQLGITVAEWFAREAARVCALLRHGTVEATQAAGLDLIRRRGGVTVNEWRRCRKLSTNHEAELELREYVRAGKLRTDHRPSGPQGGRPREVFMVVDDEDSPATPET